MTATAGMEERGEKSSIGSRGQMCSAPPPLSLSRRLVIKGTFYFGKTPNIVVAHFSSVKLFIFNRCLCLCSVEDLHVALVGLLVFQERSFAFILI